MIDVCLFAIGLCLSEIEVSLFAIGLCLSETGGVLFNSGRGVGDFRRVGV